MPWSVEQKTDTAFGTVAWGTSGNGPALVLAHGWPWSSYSWHRVIPALEERYTVYWYDMIGFGQSSKDDGLDTSLATQGLLFGKMLEFWNLENPTVWAHDFGGAVSLRAHLLHGHDYANLVLMNVVALSPWGSEFFDHVGKHVDAFTGLPPHIHDAIVRAYIGGALVNDLPDADLESLAEPWLSDEGAKSFYKQFALADDKYTDEFFDRLAAMRCPVTVAWGEKDPWIPLARGQKLHAQIPGSDFIPISGAGHLPQLELPETVLNKVAGSLTHVHSVPRVSQCS